MKRLVCKKEFTNKYEYKIGTKVFHFEVGKTYNYWTNFGGANHIVEDHSKEVYSFSGGSDDFGPDDRPLIWDYFSTIEDWRHNQINKITFVDYISTIDGNPPSEKLKFLPTGGLEADVNITKRLYWSKPYYLGGRMNKRRKVKLDKVLSII